MAKKIKDENGNVYVKKKPFYKRVWFWILIVILIFIGFGSAGSKNDSKNSAGNSSSSSSNASKINQTNFDKINISETDGTSKADVEKMFGKKPSSSSSQTIQGVSADECIWHGTSLGSTVTVAFANGHAISKGIAGLPNSSKVSTSQYNAIQNGMTKNEVIKKLGKPTGRTYSSIAGQNAEMLEYIGKGNVGANMNVTIINGTVSGKAQSGMNN